MDNLTHTLFALTLAHTSLRSVGPGTTTTLVVGSNAPDLDIVTAFAGGGVGYLAAHRGVTHGPIGIVMLGALSAGIARLAHRRARVASLLPLGGLAALLHVAMDLATSYGTRIFSPFDWHWYVVDWLPIIDIYLLGMLAAGLILARLRPARRATTATVVLVFMMGNYGVRAAAHQIAVTRARAELVMPPCGGAPSVCGPSIDVAALPSFGSPLRWRLVRRYSDGYRLEDVDLFSGPLAKATWIPDENGPAVALARQTRTAAVFLDFARFPAARVYPGSNGATLVRWEDMRFLGPPFLPVAEQRGRGAFVVTVRIDAAGHVVGERLGGE